MTIVNDKQKYVFIQIPKTGSSSVGFAFHKQLRCPEPFLHHQTLRQIESHNNIDDSYFVFTFVRNPWDRLVSLWSDFTQERGRQYSGTITLEKDWLTEFGTFHNFCLEFPNSYLSDDVFTRPQVDFIESENIGVDFIGRYEELDAGFKQVCGHVMHPYEKLPHIRKTKHSNYRDYYNDESMGSVASFYKQDIDRFKYEF